MHVGTCTWKNQISFVLNTLLVESTNKETVKL